MRIILTQTTSTFMIDMPDQCAAGGPHMPLGLPAPGGRPVKADNPFSAIADLLGKLRTEAESGRDSKLWTPPKEPTYGTPLS